MTNYYLNSNKQPSTTGGNYEVHRYNCPYLTLIKGKDNYIYLGYFSSSKEAVKYAKNKHSSYANSIDGCWYCCNNSHHE